MTYNQVDKANDIPNWNNSDSRQLIRGFFVLHPDAAHGGQTGSLTAGAPSANPADGDTVQLQVRVHNYSLDTAATGVPVEFWAVARDANDEDNVGARRLKLGTVTLDTIPALGWVPANFLWSTTGMAPTGAQRLPHLRHRRPQRPQRTPTTPGTTSSTPGPTATTTRATVDGTPPTRHLAATA